MRPARIVLAEAVAVIREARRASDVVITSMGSAREWMAMGPLHPLDFVYVPSSMGEAPALGLGIALAQPSRGVIACNGDGSMLMNLGSLVTIAAEAPRNFTLVIFDNGVYEVTGAQYLPGTRVDYAAIARACGWREVHRFRDEDKWRMAAPKIFNGVGPTCVVLDVWPVPGAVGPRSPGPTAMRAPNFMKALQG
jgi:sulfopyruvate decarboxylase subunit beta